MTLLEGETDTIGEYVSLYQTQRKALQIEYREKDNMLNTLQREKSELQEDVNRLRQLVHHLSQSKPIINTSDEVDQDMSSSIDPPVDEVIPAENTTILNNLTPEATTGEIMMLLNKLDSYELPAINNNNNSTTINNYTKNRIIVSQINCPCCTGELIVV